MLVPCLHLKEDLFEFQGCHHPSLAAPVHMLSCAEVAAGSEDLSHLTSLGAHMCDKGSVCHQHDLPTSDCMFSIEGLGRRYALCGPEFAFPACC
jgi:hypothetical protein